MKNDKGYWWRLLPRPPPNQRTFSALPLVRRPRRTLDEAKLGTCLNFGQGSRHFSALQLRSIAAAALRALGCKNK